MHSESPAPGRSRSPRSRRYDEAILDAAVTIVDLEGWSELTFQHLADRAGVSRTAVASRYADRAELAAAVWRQRLTAMVQGALRAVVAACDGASAQDLAHACSPFTYPGESMRAAGELLLVARYEPVVQQAIDETLGGDLAEWLTPRRGRLSRARAAQHATLLALALGLLVEARRIPGARLDLGEVWADLARALANPAEPTWLPQQSASYMDEPEFEVDDPAWAAVLRAAVLEVGARGFDAATVDVIARTSGYTQGAIFSRYDSKMDLFLDATQRMLGVVGRKSAEFQGSIEAQHSPGIADAVMIRELMRPERKAIRTVTFEQCRLSWHQPAMLEALQAALEDPDVNVVLGDRRLTQGQARAWIHGDFARSLGLGLLADLFVGAWRLPYEVVSVPFLAG